MVFKVQQSNAPLKFWPKVEKMTFT